MRDNTTGLTGSTATARFIIATNTNIDVTNGGTVATGSGNLGFGASRACMTVEDVPDG
jgi:hypothetical protein